MSNLFYDSNIKKITVLDNILSEPMLIELSSPSNDDNTNATTYSDLNDGFLLIASNIYGRMNMSMDAAENEIKDIGEVVKLVMSFVKCNVLNALQRFEGAQKALKECLTVTEKRVNSAIGKVETEKKLGRQLQKKHKLCLPKVKIVGQFEKQVGDIIETRNYKVTVMPIEHQIQQFLGKTNVLQNILENQARLENETSICIKSFLNTKSWTKIKEKFSGKTVIPIYLYDDDFGPDDGLSPHGSSNLISGYYYSFPTLPVHMASSIESIFVAMLAKVRDIKAVGHNKLMKILVDELLPL